MGFRTSIVAPQSKFILKYVTCMKQMTKMTYPPVFFFGKNVKDDLPCILCVSSLSPHLKPRDVLRPKPSLPRAEQRWQPLEDGRWGRVVGREGGER
jgi:hypothetical protein